MVRVRISGFRIRARIKVRVRVRVNVRAHDKTKKECPGSAARRRIRNIHHEVCEQNVFSGHGRRLLPPSNGNSNASLNPNFTPNF